jgi:excisionase family DNA binding protein
MSMSTVIAPQTVLPPTDPADLEVVTSVLDRVPADVRKGLAAFVDALSAGDAVRVEPLSTMITTTQAAEILNVSRMTVVKLLDEGLIDYQQPSVHRQLRLADVLAYKEERSKKRTAYLEQSMRDAADDSLLDVDIADYTEALRAARKRHPA